MNSATKYHVKQLEQLKGATIGKPVVSYPDEMGVLEFFGLDIKTADGRDVVLWFLMDEEGNGPGSFEIQNLFLKPE